MSQGRPGSAWRVEFTQSASDAFRALPPVVRRAVAEVVEEMRGGPSGAEERDPTEPTLYRLTTPAGPRLRFVVRSSDRALLVVGIEASGRVTPATASSRFFDARFRDILDDVRYAVRTLRRSPAFTLGVVLTLAVGLGGATTIFGLVDTVFNSALPFDDDDGLLRIRSLQLGPDGEEFAFNVTPRDFDLIRSENRVFEGVIAQSGGSVAVLGDGAPIRASAIGVSQGWASLLGVRPMLGRTFTPEEEALGQDAGVALISHSLWERRFGADPNVIGTALRHESGTLLIVGVLGSRFAYPYDADLWRPWRLDPSDWTSSDLNIVARLRPGVDVADARADAIRVYAALKAESPGVAPNAGFSVERLRDDFIRDEAAALQSLSFAVLFLFLLVCVNVANLFTARLAARRREMALRAALGAGRGRLVRAALVESVLLFLLGGVGALVLTIPFGEAVSVLIPVVFRNQLALDSAQLGPMAISFAVGAALLAGLGTGLVASWRASRVDLQTVLRGTRGVSASGGRLRDGLVVAELALSLGLLLGAGVLAEHFRDLQRADLGFDTEGLYTAQIAVEGERYGSPEARIAMADALRESILAIPGVQGVGMTSVNPLCCGDWGASIRVEGLEQPEGDPPIVIHHRYVTPEYFTALGVPIVRGRNFSAEDRLDTPPVVIVDADLAERFWPGQNPIGKRVGMIRDDELRTIVGVARIAYAEGDERETWYVPFRQDPLGRSTEILHLMIRSESSSPLEDVRTATAAVDPTLAVFGASTMNGLRREIIAQDQIGAVIVSVFALAGLLLSGIGLYGLLAYQVELRRRELGTRIALGAGKSEVASLILSGAARLFVAAVALGGVLAYALNGTLARLVDGVELADPGMFIGLVAVLGVAVLISTLLPTVRALSVDPARVLQVE